MHRILHRHRIRSGEEPGQKLLAPAMPPTSSRASPSATKARSAAVMIIAAAILASVFVYSGTNADLRRLRRGNVRHRHADLDRQYQLAWTSSGRSPTTPTASAKWATTARPTMGRSASTKTARQILSDLDAVGNTTKAITKGIAIGSAVIAAVSLFNSYIVSVGSGGKGENRRHHRRRLQRSRLDADDLHPDVVRRHADRRGGAVPVQPHDDSRRRPGGLSHRQRMPAPIPRQGNLGRHQEARLWHASSTSARTSAQKELVGPGLLAIFVPITVGFVAGDRTRLAGFLAGMIVVGQLLAVFMANAGGAWDNAKKMIEDEPVDSSATPARGARCTRPAVTGDTVGDPLKDTAGPAINPLIKVMNMVSLLIIGLDFALRHGHDRETEIGRRLFGADESDSHVLGGDRRFASSAWRGPIWQSKRSTPEAGMMRGSCLTSRVSQAHRSPSVGLNVQTVLLETMLFIDSNRKWPCHTNFDIAVIAGDGIGPEVTAEAIRAVDGGRRARRTPLSMDRLSLGNGLLLRPRPHGSARFSRPAGPA